MLETEDMEVDDPSVLNTAMNETAWAKLPSFAHEPSGYHALPRDVLPIEKELDTWLNHTSRGKPSTDIDILSYWKEQEKHMPLLGKVARKFYGIPVTSACSERLFSVLAMLLHLLVLCSTQKGQNSLFTFTKTIGQLNQLLTNGRCCLLYTSPSPRD